MGRLVGWRLAAGRSRPMLRKVGLHRVQSRAYLVWHANSG